MQILYTITFKKSPTARKTFTWQRIGTSEAQAHEMMERTLAEEFDGNAVIVSVASTNLYWSNEAGWVTIPDNEEAQ